MVKPKIVPLIFLSGRIVLTDAEVSSRSPVRAMFELSFSTMSADTLSPFPSAQV
jgi:TATA-box binding protein (TBP) (component of TFIID and TFIIIB)